MRDIVVWRKCSENALECSSTSSTRPTLVIAVMASLSPTLKHLVYRSAECGGSEGRKAALRLREGGRGIRTGIMKE